MPAERARSLYFDSFTRNLESAAAVGSAGDVDYRVDLVLVPVDRHPAQSRIDVVSIDRLARYGLGVIDLAENLVRLIEIPSYHHHLGFIELDNHLAFLLDPFLLCRAPAKQDRDDYQRYFQGAAGANLPVKNLHSATETFAAETLSFARS